MKPIVQLVTEFDAFEEQVLGGSIEDFCRYYLARNAGKRKEELVGGHIPPNPESLLMKIFGRLITVYGVYVEAMMTEIKMPSREAFYLLNTLHHLNEAKKTEFINQMLMGYTTGMDAITKLIKEGLVQEREHDTDKRAKLISLTDKGRDALKACYPYMHRVSKMLLKGLHPDAIQLCISLLSDLEIRQSKLVHEVKGKDFEEMYQAVMDESTSA